MGVHQEVYPFNFILPLNLDSRDFQGVVRILTECEVFLRGCLREQEAVSSIVSTKIFFGYHRNTNLLLYLLLNELIVR